MHHIQRGNGSCQSENVVGTASVLLQRILRRSGPAVWTARRMRSSHAQRLFSNLLASTSGRGSGALTPTSQSAAAQAALGQTCQFHARQSGSPFAQLLTQRSGPQTLPSHAATANSRPHAWREQDGSLATMCWRQEQWQWPHQQHHGRCLHTSPAVQQEFVTLNNLQDNEGARRWVRTSARHVAKVQLLFIVLHK